MLYPIPTAQLVTEYRAAGTRPSSCERLRFVGVDGRDVYNVSGVFTDPTDARLLIAGRVEDRSSEHSTVIVFAEDGGSWSPLIDAASLDLQDPFVFQHAGARYLGGVEIAEYEDADGTPALRWRTAIYDHSDLRAPVRAFVGPWGMKDLRFVDLPDGRLGVLTRPQGGPDGPGRIGFTVVDSLTTLTHADLDRAPRLENLFAAAEWGGANHAWIRDDGRIGILGHIAHFDEHGTRHYYPVTFELDPDTRDYTAPRILFERADLPAGPAKRPDLEDIIFPGWVDIDSPTPVVYCGVSDAEAFRVELPSAR